MERNKIGMAGLLVGGAVLVGVAIGKAGAECAPEPTFKQKLSLALEPDPLFKRNQEIMEENLRRLRDLTPPQEPTYLPPILRTVEAARVRVPCDPQPARVQVVSDHEHVVSVSAWRGADVVRVTTPSLVPNWKIAVEKGVLFLSPQPPTFEADRRVSQIQIIVEDMKDQTHVFDLDLVPVAPGEEANPSRTIRLVSTCPTAD